MLRTVRLAQWSVIGCLAALLLGCGPTDNTATTYPVKGAVKIDGAPLPSGRIFFEDIPRGINNSAEIINGEFSGQVAAGDLKARVVKIEKIKGPMGNDDIDKETELKRDISVTIKSGSNTLPPIEVGAGAP